MQELCVGTFRDVAVVPETAPIYTALEIFVDRRVSALPVINDAGTWGGDATSAYASGSSPIPMQKPPPGPQAAPWGAGGAWQVVPRALSPAPALSLLAGQVVGLYSRFDVIVSTLCVCTPGMSVASCTLLMGCSHLPVPVQTHPMCTDARASVDLPCVSSGISVPLSVSTTGCEDTLGH